MNISIEKRNSFFTKLAGAQVGVMGMGRSGLSAARALKNIGARVFISDTTPQEKIGRAQIKAMKGFSTEFGGHSHRILESSAIVVSPGIHLDLPILNQARRKSIPIIGELELASQLGSFRHVTAVTGTNGKTTTTSLLGDMCMKAGFKTLVAGNIGQPLSDYISKAKNFERTVLEVSSYQLESCTTFHPQVACILNVTSDHLERHGTMARYAKFKERIFINQNTKDTAIVNWDDARCLKMKTHGARIIYFSTRKKLSKGVFFDKAKSGIRVRLNKNYLLPLPTYLPGLHNIENACAAIAAAIASGVSVSAVTKSLKTFAGVAHRLETVRTIRGITFINDSKATNVDSTSKALEALDGPLWLILGGQDKGAPYKPLQGIINKKVKGVFLIGEAAKTIKKKLKIKVRFFHSTTLENAVKESSLKAKKGDTVLLSPSCASFDQFKNFEHRGDQFKTLVHRIK